MLSNEQKIKKCNEDFTNFKNLMSGKYREYKSKKLKNPKEEIIELKKLNKKVFWKSLRLIGLFFSGSMIFNYMFFSFVGNFKESHFGDVGNMVGFINAAIENNHVYFLFWILFFPPIISTLLLTSAAFIEGHVFNFKSKGFFILNEEEFKLNYVLSKDDTIKKYKEIECIIGKKELEDVIFKVNRKLNRKRSNIIDIGAYVFFLNVYEECKWRINESIEKDNDEEGEKAISEKLGSLFKETKLIEREAQVELS